ncbi:MAG: homoserine kinase [Bacteroidota bacterium]
MRSLKVRVFGPATIANLGSGFDVLGIAIDRPGDIVVAERRKERGLEFCVDAPNASVPSDSRTNVASHVASLMLDELRPPFGIRMTLYKQMPVGSGLGSSAASSVASVVAVNALLQKPLKRPDLLGFAVEGERKASGAPHADNVAPSLLGGACLIRSYDPLDVIRVPVPTAIVWVVVHPHTVIRTEEARSILPKAVTLQTAIRQWGNISGLTIGLASGDLSLVGKCLEDAIAEPVRGNLIPGFHEVKAAALAAGAFGCSISGSGPSMFAIASSFASAHRVARAMRNTFADSAGVECDTYVSRVNRAGARVLWKRAS